MKITTTAIKKRVSMSDAELSAIVQNDNVLISTLSETEKFSIVLFDELSKALSKRKDCTFTLQCNNKNARNRENTIVSQYMLYAYAYTIQVYCKKNACSVVCSRSEAFKRCLNEHYSDLQFDTSKSEAYKNAVSYDDLYSVLVSLLAVCKLASKSKSKSKSESESKSE